MKSKLLLSALLSLIAVEISQIEPSASAPSHESIQKNATQQPVELTNTKTYDAWTDIEVKKNASGNNELTWKINAASASESFIIQRSENGKRFKTIGRRTPSPQNTAYAFEDAGFKKSAFYRIIEVDLNGKIKYSSAVKPIE